MKSDFDIAANTYDDTFTNSQIGRMQRQRVWNYLNKNFESKKLLNILELNCGTGEDALFFAQAGQNIIATDISQKMIEVGERKAALAKVGDNIQFKRLDINDLNELTFNTKFDLVFSNFGGLNCLAPEGLKKVSSQIQQCLRENGQFIAVVMPDFCVVETGYFLARLQFSKMFRRKSKEPIGVNVDGENVKTWYYSPQDFKQLFEANFSLKEIQSIGFLPSYLEKKVQRFPFLKKLDERLFATGKFQTSTDHYLIHLESKR